MPVIINGELLTEDILTDIWAYDMWDGSMLWEYDYDWVRSWDMEYRVRKFNRNDQQKIVE